MSAVDISARGMARNAFAASGALNPLRLDVREFFEGVGQGSETADTEALKAAWVEAAATPWNGGGSGTASGIRRTQIVLPAAELRLAESLSSDDVSPSNFAVSLIGCGEGATRVNLLDPSVWLVDTAKPLTSALFQDLQVIGGAGIYRNRYKPATVAVRSGRVIFNRCSFHDYAKAAIVSNSDNDPNHLILACTFIGGPQSKAIILPPGSNQLVGAGTYIAGHRYGIVLRDAGKGARVDHVRWGGQVGSPRHDIWVVPGDSGSRAGTIWGHGGTEQDGDLDVEILIADPDTSANPDHATAPTYEDYEYSTEPSAGYVQGLTVGGEYIGGNTRKRGLVYSYCERFYMDFNAKVDGSYPYLVEFGDTIAALSGSNSLAQRSTIRPRHGTATGNRNQPAMQVCNLPGFGMVTEPGEVFAGDRSVMSYPTAHSARKVHLMSQSTADMTANTATFGAMEADMRGAYDARTVTFDGKGARAQIQLDLSQAEAGHLAWLEFDIRQAAETPIDAIQLVIGSMHNSSFHDVRVSVGPDWQRISIPFLFPDTGGNVFAILRPCNDRLVEGSADSVTVGRFAAYHAPHRCGEEQEPGISADNGDSDAELTVRQSATTQRWQSPLTADRSVNLSEAGAYPGSKFRIVRDPAATGEGKLLIGDGPMKSLDAAGTWAEIEYDGVDWFVSGSGTL